MTYNMVSTDTLNWKQIQFDFEILDSRPTNSDTYREALHTMPGLDDEVDNCIAKLFGIEPDAVNLFTQFNYNEYKTGYIQTFILDFERHLDWDELFRISDTILKPILVEAYSTTPNFTVIDSDRISVKMNIQTDIECKRVAA